MSPLLSGHRSRTKTDRSWSGLAADRQIFHGWRFSCLIRQKGPDMVRATHENGAVAQLGERYNGIVEVRGSIPLGSTISAQVGNGISG